VRDLTRDDVPNCTDGDPAPIMSYDNYKNLARRNQLTVARPGKGLGSYALVEMESLPSRYQEKVRAKYGDERSESLRDRFREKYRFSATARAFYTNYRFEDGSALPADYVDEYTRNASVIEAVRRLMADTSAMRRSMQGKPMTWDETATAIEFYRKEPGHTLPTSLSRFKQKAREYEKEGPVALISKKFGNQSARKVTSRIEQLILSLDAQPERPYNKTVADMYLQFIEGRIDVVDVETGEVYDRHEFTDNRGRPLELSEATIAGVLNKPANKALRAKAHSTGWDFNNEYRPHHLRHAPEYSLSKVSLDDRDLPRKMHNGQRVKAYYAYDVASGAVIGASYSRRKTEELFLDCIRDMFRLIDRQGWQTPAEVEVEHHLVRQFADGLVKAGQVFPFVRWCNPGNSQEKRAEHFNRAKKYGVEKKNHAGIGRWYAALEANRPKIEKVYDELNNTYREPTYDYDELIADDRRDIDEYNNSLHPRQDLYPGKTRWQVLVSTQSPNLHPVDKAALYLYIGEHTKTSIRRSMYMTVMGNQYRLPTPELIHRLAPRRYDVDAYWLPDDKGEVNEVYIYQDGRYLATCPMVVRYNEATAEQTQADRDAYTEQAKYVSQFDAMMKRGKQTKVAIIERTEREAIEATPVPKEVAAPEPEQSEADELAELLNWGDPEAIRRRARASV
jgi:hypothetical protein